MLRLSVPFVLVILRVAILVDSFMVFFFGCYGCDLNYAINQSRMGNKCKRYVEDCPRKFGVPAVIEYWS